MFPTWISLTVFQIRVQLHLDVKMESHTTLAPDTAVFSVSSACAPLYGTLATRSQETLLYPFPCDLHQISHISEFYSA